MAVNRRKLLVGGAAACAAAGVGTAAVLASRGGSVERLVSARARAVPSSGQLPPLADVVIVGAGILGLTTALELAKAGMSVVVCEKGVIAGEQSSRAFGWVTDHELPPAQAELSMLSREFWRKSGQELGVDASYREQGLLELCATDEELAVQEAWLKSRQNPAAEPARMLSAAELRAKIPGGLKGDWKGAYFDPHSGGVDPSIAASAIARKAVERGVRVLENCAVRTVETAAGRVHAVHTEKGAIRTERLVVCGGSWTRMFMRNAGHDLPLLNVALSLQRVSGVDGPVGCGGVLETGWRKESGGTYSLGAKILTAPVTADSFRSFSEFMPLMSQMDDAIKLSLNKDTWRSLVAGTTWGAQERSPFEDFRISSPAPNESILDAALAHMKRELPAFENAKVIERWGGALAVAPDFAPVISHVDGTSGLFVASGFTFGISMGPASGRLLSEIVRGVKTSVDPAPFLLSRF